jgi:hypothetical protein
VLLFSGNRVKAVLLAGAGVTPAESMPILSDLPMQPDCTMISLLS